MFLSLTAFAEIACGSAATKNAQVGDPLLVPSLLLEMERCVLSYGEGHLKVWRSGRLSRKWLQPPATAPVSDTSHADLAWERRGAPL